MTRLLILALFGLAPHWAGESSSVSMTAASPASSPRVVKSAFGTTRDGALVDLFTVTNKSGVEARIMTVGGVLLSLRTPDRDGKLDDIVLGYDSLAGYLEKPSFFGCIVGRYGNRIAKARFTLDGKTYPLAANNGPNHLHGGIKGWDKMVWKGEPFERQDAAGVTLTYTSKDGEEGYPGTVKATVRYTLNDKNELAFDYEATTDKPTVINLTQHSYFNLAGDKAADILGHELMIAADRYTPVDEGLIPVGGIQSVAGTPLDFRAATPIGARIAAADVQIKRGNGYDHNFVLNRAAPGMVTAALVYEPKTGRTLEIRTTEPGVQFYTGNFLDGTIRGKGGRSYGRRSGFCLETQHYPDSPNQPDFPSTVLRPGQKYHTTTVLALGVRK